MAYGVKYRGLFEDDMGESYKIEILMDGYSSGITELDSLGSNPITLSFQGNGKKFQTIIGSEAVVEFISTSSLQWKEFAEAGSKDYQLKFYKDETGWALKWIGFIQNDMYIEPFTTPNYIIQLRAFDGLGQLKNEYYGTDRDTPFSGQNDILEELASDILGPLGFGIDIWSHVNIFAATHTQTDAYDPLNQTYFNKERLRESIIKPGNCYDALEDLLSCFGARIFQSDGVWKIIPVSEFKKRYELLTNGDFANWTGDDPDNWTVATESANNYVTENPAGQSQFIYLSGGVPAQLSQSILTSGKEYLVSVDIKTVAAGSIFIGDGGGINGESFNTTGLKTFVFSAASSSFIISCDNLADITIDDVSVKQVSIDYRVFNSSGTYQSNSYYNPIIDITAHDADIPVAWANNEQTVQIIKGYKEFSILRDYGFKKNLIENPDFKDEFWSDANTIIKWTKSNVGTWLKRSNNRALMDTSVASVGAGKHITAHVADHANMDGNYIRVKVDYDSVVNGTGIGTIGIRLRAVDGATYRYLDSSGAWQVSSATYITATTDDSSISVTSRTNALLSDASIDIYLWEPADTTADPDVWWRKVDVSFIKGSGGTYQATIDEYRLVNSGDVLVPSDYPSKLGEISASDNYEDAYWGGFLTLTGLALGDWNHKGISDGDIFIDHFSDDIDTQFDGSSYRLAGTLYSNILKFTTLLSETVGGSTHYFIPTRLAYNVKRCTWQGEWLEIK